MNMPLVDRSATSPGARRQLRLDGVSRPHDPRVHAIRPDLADVALADMCFAPHYAKAIERCCTAASVVLRSKPGAEEGAISELLYGEAFHMLDARADWAWGYCGHDHYVGYLPVASLGDRAPVAYRTTAPAPLYHAANRQALIIMHLPGGALLGGVQAGDFLDTGSGFTPVDQLRPLADPEQDWVAVAERYLGMPYVWGGRGGAGIDCSGLVQMALTACGRPCPRDSDQQAAALGADLDADAALRRGDLVFFPVMSA
jgi:cell wall-associated NlpC family hydrolase